MQKIECHMLISQTPSPKEKIRETRLSDSDMDGCDTGCLLIEKQGLEFYLF